MPPAMFKAAAKQLSGRYLSLAEREEIALLLVQGHSLQDIGRRRGRSASTISREVRRNATTRGGGLDYRATVAQWHAERSARRPKTTKLAGNPALRSYVEERLAGVVRTSCGSPVPRPAISWKGRRHGPRQDRRWAWAWSPEQIARRLAADFPDESAQYAAEAYRQRLVQSGVTPSMSRRGDCLDNAPMESFFHTLKAERVHHRVYPTRVDARRDLFGYIEGFYNSRRLHSSLGYISPAEAERRAA